MHLDDGQLRALLDDELDHSGTGSARTHLDGCAECSDLLTQIDAGHTAVRNAIAILDVTPPLNAARETVRAQVFGKTPDAPEAASNRTATRANVHFTLRRAAVIALLLTGLSAALPGSAVRAWMVSGWRAVVEMIDTTEAPPTSGSVNAAQQPGEAGVRFEIADAPLDLVLRQIESGSLVVVRFVDGGRAAFNGTDARFRRTADGHFEVTGGSGTIRIDLPRTVTDAVIRVNERIYLTMAGGEINLSGPSEVRGSEEISFRVP